MNRKQRNQFKMLTRGRLRHSGVTLRPKNSKVDDRRKAARKRKAAAFEARQMLIDDFITKYCSDTCDKAGHPDCAVSFDGSCAKSRQLKIEVEGASGV